jgi:4a-hydroxytetrahydrobiopterin dehydratase
MLAGAPDIPAGDPAAGFAGRRVCRAPGLSAGAAIMTAMTETSGGESRMLTRTEASDAVSGLGWRFILGWLRANVPAGSVTEAAALAVRAAEAAGPDAGDALWVDVRHDGVVLGLQDRQAAGVTGREVRLAGQITAALGEAGYVTEPGIGGPVRSVQMLEIAIDAMDIPAVRPFWKAVLGYVSEPGADGSYGGLVDPVGQGPAIWFQQMDAARPQRNRIHFDISVPHDEAKHRIGAALAAGGRLLADDEAPAFWVLADAEGNEACVTTWQGRD